MYTIEPCENGASIYMIRNSKTGLYLTPDNRWEKHRTHAMWITLKDARRIVDELLAVDKPRLRVDPVWLFIGIAAVLMAAYFIGKFA